eukprot:2367588-Pyramimonas_sp.AAC.1
MRNRREAAGPDDENRSSPRAASQRPRAPRERVPQGADAPHLFLRRPAGGCARCRQYSGLVQSVQANAAHAAALRQEFDGALAIIDPRIAEYRRIIGELQCQ